LAQESDQTNARKAFRSTVNVELDIAQVSVESSKTATRN